MRRILLLALVAVPVIVIVTFPARLVVGWTHAPDNLDRVRGSVWSGEARWRQPGRGPLALEWRVSPDLDWHWRAVDAAGGDGTDVRGRWRPGGEGLNLSRITGRVALARLDLDHWLVNARPRGILELDIDRARLARGRVPDARGRIRWRQASLEGAVQASLGEIQIELEPGDDAQLARVDSTGEADVLVDGRIVAGAERYRVDLRMRASPDRPDLVRPLSRLGEVQPDGQVRIELSGALGW